MKYKKYTYILVLIMMLLIGNNKIYAATNEKCYYMSEDKETLVSYNPNTANFVIEQRGKMSVDWFKNDPLINNGVPKLDKSETGIMVEAIASGTCPSYIVYRHKDRWLVDSDGVWGFTSKTQANTFYTYSKKIKNMSAWLLSYKDESGEKYTETEFYTQEIQNTNSISESVGGTTSGTEINGTRVEVNCDGIFGNKNDPDSLRYLLDEIMRYPRYIVPIIVIGLGMMDLAKAVIASKEDEMKKAQSTFVKRCLIGACVFLIPIFVDIIMSLADIAWNGQYPMCKL